MNAKDCLELFDNMTTKDFSQGADKPVREYLADLATRHEKCLFILDGMISEFREPAVTALKLARIRIREELDLN